MSCQRVPGDASNFARRQNWRIAPGMVRLDTIAASQAASPRWRSRMGIALLEVLPRARRARDALLSLRKCCTLRSQAKLDKLRPGGIAPSTHHPSREPPHQGGIWEPLSSHHLIRGGACGANRSYRRCPRGIPALGTPAEASASITRIVRSWRCKRRCTPAPPAPSKDGNEDGKVRRSLLAASTLFYAKHSDARASPSDDGVDIALARVRSGLAQGWAPSEVLNLVQGWVLAALSKGLILERGRTSSEVLGLGCGWTSKIDQILSLGYGRA